MEVMLVVGGVALAIPLVAFVVMLSIRQRRAWEAALTALADEVGGDVAQGSWGSPRVEADVDGLTLVVDTYTVSTGKSSATYTRVRVTGGQPSNLKLSSEGVMASIGKTITGDNVEVGDPSFDGSVFVRGIPRAHALAWASSEARSAIGAAVGSGAKLDGQEWTMSVGGMVTDAARLVSMAHTVLAAARHLSSSPPVVEGLRARLLDPEPGVREAALDELIDARGISAERLRELVVGDDPRLAVMAASVLGEGGRAPLRQLLEVPSVARAAAAALSRLPPGPERPQLEAFLLENLDRDWLDGIDALGRIATVAAVQALRPLTGVTGGEAGRRAREAIRTIQSRGEGGAGGLALAEGEGGALSVADGVPNAGALSASRRQREGGGG
ncbi:MAG: hypothetical protein KC621_08505 [Myxococcales bacterium]|nr:hypothetical protein [Myxococcales bacterium]